MRVEVVVGDSSLDGTRLDIFLSERLQLFSRSQAKSRIVELTVNGRPARLGKRLKTGDTVSVAYTDAPPPSALPQDISFPIIFENEDAIVIDKPQGMVVHPGSGNRTGTLLNALLFHCGDLAARFGADDPRPGIVHRLDKDTSGVMIVAKNPAAHDSLARQFQAREARKRYVAIVKGVLPSLSGSVETRIARDPRDRKSFTCVRSGGRLAITHYRVLRSFQARGGSSPARYALVSLSPKTGRTHQLRVHMRHLGAPILGDSRYARKDPLFAEATLMLHARALGIKLPGNDSLRTFTAPLPQRFREVIRSLQSSSPRKGL